MTAIKSTSLMRKFSIIFIGAALVPFIVLYYLHTVYDEGTGIIQVLNVNFNLILFLVGITTILGFFGMHMTVKKILLLTQAVSTLGIDKLTKKDEIIISELAEEEGEIAELARSFLHALNRIGAKGQLPKETQEMVSESLKKVSEILSTTNDYDSLIQVVLENAADALGAQQGALFSADDGRYILKAWTDRNRDDVTPEEVMSAAQRYLKEVDKENVFIVQQEAGKSEHFNKLFSPPLVCSPLVRNEKLLGVLCLSGNNYWQYMQNFSNEHMSVVVNLSEQIAASLENAKINKNSDQTYFETMVALALAVEARDPYSRGHSSRVGKNAQKVGELMSLSENDIKTLSDASMLHDIGKIGILYALLVRRGKLNADEISIIRNHPVVGEIIVSNLKTYRHLLDPIRHHHEQLDGSGYPDGLESVDISLVTRILSVCDIYDVLLEHRPYRSALDLYALNKEMNYFIKLGKKDKDVIHSLYEVIKRNKTEMGKKELRSSQSRGSKNLNV